MLFTAVLLFLQISCWQGCSCGTKEWLKVCISWPKLADGDHIWHFLCDWLAQILCTLFKIYMYEGCSVSNEKSIIEWLLSHIWYFCQTVYFLRRVCEKAPWHVMSFWSLGNALVACYSDYKWRVWTARWKVLHWWANALVRRWEKCIALEGETM